MTRSLRLALLLAICHLSSAAAQEDPLARVRELYASADYEAALKSLDGLPAGAPDRTLDIDRYRALCLIGLGRSAAAEQVIERIVATNPLYQPDAADVSPAVRAAFDRVRRRVLPDVAHELFATAKAAYDRQALAEAAAEFRHAQQVLDSLDLSEHPDLINLRTLSVGFWELTRSALPPTADPPKVATTPQAEPTPAPTETDDSDSEPRPIQQEMPRWTFAIAAAHYDARFRATVDVDIDELGNVTAVEIIQSSHPGYNRVLLEAVRGWKYQPALRDSQPVKARKRVDVELRPR
jgi:TonB family protein